MNRFTINVRPGVDFRLAFRLLLEDDDGDRTTVPLDGTFRMRYGAREKTLDVDGEYVRLHLSSEETAAIENPGTYVIDKVNLTGEVERVMEGRLHASRYESVV